MGVSEKSKQFYLKTLVEALVEKYEMPLNEAKEAVDASIVKKILYENNGELAEVQMHDPLDYTITYIYCEYKGMPIEFLRTL